MFKIFHKILVNIKKNYKIFIMLVGHAMKLYAKIVFKYPKAKIIKKIFEYKKLY